MHQSFHARFQLDKGTVRHQIDDSSLDLGTDWILGFNIVPGIGKLLLQSEADAFLLVIDVEHDHINFLPDGQKFGWMVDSAPAHIGYVKQAIQTIEVNKCSEIRDILHRPR